MANLGVPEETTEFHDSPEELADKVDQLADLVKRSRKMVIHTGAGISTSAGIPDFRGPQGVWTLRAQGLSPKRSPGAYAPTLTHMAIVGLLEAGRLYHLISQNTDGLHIRSGIPTDKISELHGNTNMEQCTKCGHRFIRKFHTRTAHDVHDHRTGRKCELCGGPLKDTIINFGENLPRDQLEKAYQVSQEADLAIVLGSSMRVSPANDLPLTTAKRGKPLVMVNLQKTPLDSACRLRIFAKTDEVMAMLAERLQMEIPMPRDVAGEPPKAAPKPKDPHTKAVEPVRMSRDELMQLSVVKLKEILHQRGLKSDDCVEKKDLVDKVLNFCTNVTYYVPLDG